MKKLILNLEAPMMSFATAETRWDIFKDTKLSPTHSAIVGMIGAALGYQRNSNELEELYNAIEIRVIEKTTEVDSEEEFFSKYMTQTVEDFQIMSTKRRDQFVLIDSHKGFNKASGGRQRGNNIIRKIYLEDESFKVEVTADDEVIDRIFEALRHPYYPYYIGRACCIPAAPVVGSGYEG